MAWHATGLTPVHIAYFCGALALFVVSLVDDLRPLAAPVRFVVQFAAAMAVVGAAKIALTAVLVPVVAAGLLVVIVFVIIGLINVYNFMDGIDGIAGLQAVVGGVAWVLIAERVSAPTSAVLGAVVAGACLGFLTLNWPPAKIFMGDAGSTVIGYSFGAIPLLVYVEAAPQNCADVQRIVSAALLVVWPFLADGTFTILRRLKNGENIFKAHRSHLYQRLVIAGHSHRTVTLVYGILAAVGALLAVRIVSGDRHAVPVALCTIPTLFFGLWCWTRSAERRTLV